jgi:hypothetical protein
MKRKIGIVTIDLKLRYDIRLFLSSFTSRDDIEVVVLTLPGYEDLYGLEQLTEVRKVPNLPTTTKNRLLLFFFKYFGHLPKNRSFFLFYSLRSKSKLNLKWYSDLYATILTYLKIFLPSVVTYDFVLQNLNFSKNPIEDLEHTFSLTSSTVPENLFAEIVQRNLVHSVYLNSWDHPAKFNRFAQHSLHYLVWNSSLKDDLISLHGISPNRIALVGSTQLCSISDFLREKHIDLGIISSQDPIGKYIYFVASVGYPEIAKFEVIVVTLISDYFKENYPDISILFRPYPMLDIWDIYLPLKACSNVTFDPYNKSQNPTTLNLKDVYYKFHNISNALCVIHLGTTVGIEASYFNIPIVYVCSLPSIIKPNKFTKLFYSSWKQHHLKTYYELEYPNVVRNFDDIYDLLDAVISFSNDYLAYGNEISKMNQLLLFSDVCNNFVSTIPESKKLLT